MEPWIIITGAAILLISVVVIGVFLLKAQGQNSPGRGNVEHQGSLEQQKASGKKVNLALKVRKQTGQIKQTRHYGEDEELSRRLKCAGWSMRPITYKALWLGSGCLFALLFVVFGFGIKILWLPFGFAVGVIIVKSSLERAMKKRFKNFDDDYPNVLLSLVGLLRTGMNPMQALEVAVEGLGDESLLKLEVIMMNERLKYGLTEEVAIGLFGEHIDHPEIELLVQTLMLSRKLGGAISDTLERLSKQVRKRQFFRASALSAVSLQKGSVWVILGILIGLLGYILLVYPSLVTEGFNTSFGKVIWQVGIMMMMTGVWWVGQVTKIKV